MLQKNPLKTTKNVILVCIFQLYYIYIYIFCKDEFFYPDIYLLIEIPFNLHLINPIETLCGSKYKFILILFWDLTVIWDYKIIYWKK